MEKRYSASVVGAGRGGKLSIKALRASDRYELKAIADVRPEALEEWGRQIPGLRTFSSHREMFEACPTDVVCVSTWPPSHREISLEALRRPLTGILVEKPLADRAADGDAILGAIRTKGIPVAVPHGLLTDRHVQEIVRRVRGAEIGDLKLVEIQNARWDIMNAGIHWLNFFVVLVGGETVSWVMAACDTATRTFRDGMQAETIAVTYAETRSGVRVVMNTGDEVNVSRAGKECLFRLVGTRGLVEFWARESAYWIVSPAEPGGRLVEVARDPRTHHHAHLDLLAGQMDVGRPDYGIAESSLAALEICEAAYLSHRHRCRVDLPLEGFIPPAPSGWDPGAPYRGEGGGRDGKRLPPIPAPAPPPPSPSPRVP